VFELSWVSWIDYNTIVDKHPYKIQIYIWQMANAHDEFFCEECITPVRCYLTAAVVTNTNGSSDSRWSTSSFFLKGIYSKLHILLFENVLKDSVSANCDTYKTIPTAANIRPKQFKIDRDIGAKVDLERDMIRMYSKLSVV
jgi:hypothetical protein